MEYTINRANRNATILCSSFLILYVIVMRLSVFFNPPTKIDIAERLILNITYLIPLGYIMLTFFKYFRNYKLTILQLSVTIIFIVELIFKSTLFSDLLKSNWKMIFMLSAHAIWTVAMITMIVGSFRNKIKVYPGMLSIRNYAIGSLLIAAFTTTYPFYFKPINLLGSQQLIELTSAIPYIFVIAFAIKIKLKE